MPAKRCSQTINSDSSKKHNSNENTQNQSTTIDINTSLDNAYLP